MAEIRGSLQGDLIREYYPPEWLPYTSDGEEEYITYLLKRLKNIKEEL